MKRVDWIAALGPFNAPRFEKHEHPSKDYRKSWIEVIPPGTRYQSIPVISVRQPWAWAMFADSPNRKDIENRTWTTQYSGPLFIQASSTKGDMKYLDRVATLLDIGRRPEQFELVFGAILGMVWLEPVEKSFESDSDWAAPQEYHWPLSKRLWLNEPMRCSGRLGLWYPKGYIADTLYKQSKYYATPDVPWLAAPEPDARPQQLSLLSRRERSVGGMM